MQFQKMNNNGNKMFIRCIRCLFYRVNTIQRASGSKVSRNLRFFRGPNDSLFFIPNLYGLGDFLRDGVILDVL